MKRTQPSDIIMDMLRSARSRQRTAQSLIGAGRLFGHTENAVRVNLSRLMARGLIESPQRGLYRLAKKTDAVNDFVERWRLGETRVRPWTDGKWLLAHPQGAGKASLWALDALGFRAVRSGLFARPDNLNLSDAAFRGLAANLGLLADVLLANGASVENPVAEDWLSSWRPDELNTRYLDALTRLRQSAERLPGLACNDARLESFALGGELIHLLAKDPLLPPPWVDVAARSALWQAMLEYDVLGKEVWAEGKGEQLQHMPRPHMAIVC
jgi:phenylacetic acid degradation operon negative regulatory protein